MVFGMNKLCHLDVDPGILYNTQTLGSICPCYWGNFPNKSSFSAGFRMISSFLPGRIADVMYLSFRFLPKASVFLPCYQIVQPMASFVSGILTLSCWKCSLPQKFCGFFFLFLYSFIPVKINWIHVQYWFAPFVNVLFTPASWHPAWGRAGPAFLGCPSCSLHFPLFWMMAAVWRLHPPLFGSQLDLLWISTSRGPECGGSREFLFVSQMPWEVHRIGNLITSLDQ